MAFSASSVKAWNGGWFMHTKGAIFAAVVLSALLVVGQGGACAQGTPLSLGAGQELRIDLPLEAGKSYEISLELRTDLEDAGITMTLCLIGSNNEATVYKMIDSKLEQGDWNLLSLGEVQIPRDGGRWELVLAADQAGRYYWRDLKVLRTYRSSLETQAYWSERLASQGTFYTGLVVDARHLDVRRGISPRIYSESGQLIYGGVLAPQDLVQERGIVGYGSELTPELLTRLQVDPDYPYTAPLTVTAIGVVDPAKTSVYISNEDTQRILEAMAQYDFFARYAVIFLVN